MMPMPPTSSEIDATAASRSAMIRLLLSAVSAIWLRLRTSKSLTSPGLMRCRRSSVSVTWPIAGLHLGRADRLDIDLVDEAGQPRLQIIGIGRRQIDPVDRRLLLARRRDAEHLALGGRERDHDDIVLILAEGGLSLGGQQADHAQRHALDLHRRRRSDFRPRRKAGDTTVCPITTTSAALLSSSAVMRAAGGDLANW